MDEAREEDPLIGRTIARKYLLETCIGRGGIAAVYRASQKSLGRPVAIKILHETYLDDPTFAGRFKREARSASRLTHPNLVQVFDFGEEPDGRLYMAMEYLEGANLHHMIRNAGPLSREVIVDIMSQGLAALAVAHEGGLIHRDLKPHNMVVSSGRDDDGNEKRVVKLCDFGFVKNIEVRSERDGPRTTVTLTKHGRIIGTPEYMSPEQASADDDLDARSDLYSMGIVLYEMLTGRVPFRAKGFVNLAIMQVDAVPPKPSTVAEGVDPELEAVCLKALEKKPENRYQTAREMRSAVRAAIGIKDATGPSSRPPKPSPSAGAVAVGRVATPKAEKRMAPAPVPPVAAPRASYLPILIGVVIAVVGIAVALLVRR